MSDIEEHIDDLKPVIDEALNAHESGQSYYSALILKKIIQEVLKEKKNE